MPKKMRLLVLIVALGVVNAAEQDECRGVLPIPTEKCNEYILIHHGKPYTYECPDGLLFDKNSLRCDLPENAECLESNECVRIGVECPNADIDHPVYRPLPNCTEYCECSVGISHVRRCPDDLHWNPFLNACDFPEDAGCTTWTTSSTTTTSNTTTSTTTTSTTTTTSQAPETTTPASDDHAGTEICLKEGVECHGNEPAYQAISDCSKFCQCSNGRPFLKSCPAGLHFNPELNVCDWPDNAGCVHSTTTERTTTYHPTTRDPWSNECDKEHVVCPKHGCHPEYHPLSNCADFCICYDGEATLQHCPPGLHFNPILHVCDYPESAGCHNSTTTEPAPTTWAPVTRSPTDGTIICLSQGVECPSVDPATPVYRAVSHCRQFCECSNGTPYLFDCPNGTLFNEKLDVCDYPYNVYCSV